MSCLVINGGVPLCGAVSVQGAKNSVLPVLCACYLSDGECVIENCPAISDVKTSADILEGLGCRTSFDGRSFYADPRGAEGYAISDSLMRRMRSSIVFLGSVLSKTGKAKVSLPGGCEIGSRPVDMHFSALARMGVHITEEHGYINCEAARLHGASIALPFPSVGATENIMLAASKADGVTVLTNAAREPEIVDLQHFLNAMGADIDGAGTSVIRIRGVERLHGVSYRVIPDRIVAATYLCAVAATKGNALIRHAIPSHLTGFLDVMRRCGCKIEEFPDAISVECDRLHSPDGEDIIRTMPYPGFPTDAGSPFVAAMTVARGTTVFSETVFDNRYKYIGELIRLGARIRNEGRVAVIDGVSALYGAALEATDLRGGAALCVSALAANGETTIAHADYIERGYESIDKDMASLGADIHFE